MTHLEAIITVLSAIGSSVTLITVIVRIFVLLHRLKSENDKALQKMDYEITTRVGMINQVNDSLTHTKTRLLADIGNNSSRLRRIEIFLAKTTAFTPDED